MFVRGLAEAAAAIPMEPLYSDEEAPMSEPFPQSPAGARKARSYRLAGRLVEPGLNRITRDGAVLQVEPKVMQVLEALVAGGSDVVTKDELIGRVWEGVFVSDDVLVRAIGELRKVLEDGDGSDAPAVIETIRKRGYRLLAPVVYDLPAVEPARAFAVAPPAVASGAPPRSAARGLWLAFAGACAGGILAFAWLHGRDAGRAGAAAGSARFLPFTTLDGNEYVPLVSPDGTRVVFGWMPKPGEPRDLYLKLLGGDGMLRLTNDAAEEYPLAWSPDGTQVTYLRIAGADCTAQTVSALGGSPRLVAPCAKPRARFAVSPDGAQVVATKAAAVGWQGRLFVSSRDGSGERPLVTLQPGDDQGEFVDAAPAFSPDGRFIAFTRWLTDSVGDLYVVPAAGGSARRLTTDNADTMGFSWAGSGSILFSSNRAGMYSLWSVAVDGGQPTLVAGGGRKIKHPSVSRDGRVVAYEGWNYDMNLAALHAPFPAGAPQPLATATDEWTFEPRLSRDGSSIAFTSTRSGSYEIWTATADGANPVRLTNFGGAYVGAPRFSPDGRSVVFVARPQGQADIYIVDLAGGTPRRLSDDPADDLAPSFSVDGDTVYFASRRTADWQVHAVPRGGGAARAVTAAGGYAAIESGGYIYHSRSDRGGLWRRRLSAPPAESSELVEGALPAGDSANFGVLADGRHYWVSPSTDTTPARIMTRSGAQPAAVLTDLPGMAWAGVEVSADGRRVLYSRIGRNDSNIVVMLR